MSAGTKDLMADAEKIMGAIESVVRILGPLPSEDRQRIIQGAMMVLRESAPKAVDSDSYPNNENNGAEDTGLPKQARLWMKQNGLTSDMLSQVFDITEGETEVIVGELAGKNNTDKTIRAYLLVGIAGFLSSGELAFQDKTARELCEKLGCYDSTNHSKRMKEKGNNFVGDKDRGWKLTAPGLKFGAALVKEIAEKANA